MSFISTMWETNRPMMILFTILIVVIPFLVFYIVKAQKEHPKGLIAAALSNMGERFWLLYHECRVALVLVLEVWYR